jgi:hypothetical protein
VHAAAQIARTNYRSLRPRRAYDSSVRGCFIGLIWLVACYAPVPPSDVPCSPGGDCPEGQTCSAGKCVFAIETLQPDAAIITPPAGDRDLDGVPDVSDNCPDLANPDQTANEDGDRFGDACDLCPQLSDAASVDTDGDHVGDACDPNPGARDTVWLFEGFHKGLPAWVRSLNWTAVPDKLRVTSSGNINDVSEYAVLPLTSPSGTFDNFSVTAPVLVEQTMGSNGDHSIGLEIYDETAQRGVDCMLDMNPTSPSGILLMVDDFNKLNQKLPLAWTTSTVYRLTLARHGSTYTCTAVGPGGTQTISGTSAVVPRSNGAVDVWAFGMTAQVASVFVAGTP